LMTINSFVSSKYISLKKARGPRDSYKNIPRF
jgi:hypothetical protein